MIQCSAACKKSLFEYRSSSCVILAIQKLSPNAQQLFWTQLSVKKNPLCSIQPLPLRHIALLGV